MMSAVDDDRAVTPPGAERNLRRLGQDFYRPPAVDCATDFLGKVLVHDTAAGRLAGVISDVEAYPAFVDGVHHGNKRTARSEVMWGPGGRAYVYLVYGIWHQFAAVVNSKDVPDVVFIRAVAPVEGADVMAAQWNNPVETKALANSPGKLCRSFAITTEHYGADLCRYELFLEDLGPDRARKDGSDVQADRNQQPAPRPRLASPSPPAAGRHRRPAPGMVRSQPAIRSFYASPSTGCLVDARSTLGSRGAPSRTIQRGSRTRASHGACPPAVLRLFRRLS